jgi:hypothetical protein
MKRINIKVLLVWIFCLLIVAATTASVFVTKASRASPPSFNALSTPVFIVRNSLVGSQLRSILTADTSKSGLAIDGLVSPLSPLDMVIASGRLAHFSQ